MKQADKVNRIQFSLSLISLSDAVNILKHVMRLLLAECKSRGSRVHTSAFPQERTGFIANVDWRPTCPMTIKLFRRAVAPAPKCTNTHTHTRQHSFYEVLLPQADWPRVGSKNRFMFPAFGCWKPKWGWLCWRRWNWYMLRSYAKSAWAPGGIHEWASKQRQNQSLKYIHTYLWVCIGLHTLVTKFKLEFGLWGFSSFSRNLPLNYQ